MREIEFRGLKKTDRKWIHGFIAISEMVEDYLDEGDVVIFPKITSHDYSCGGNFDCGGMYGFIPSVEEGENVDPKTVGQFTGLLDKNGTKIFEGDIVREMDTTYCRLVAFGKLGYDSNWNGLTGFGFKDNERDYYGEENKFMEIRFHDDPERLIVIGNIHDNPELLESEVAE